MNRRKSVLSFLPGLSRLPNKLTFNCLPLCGDFLERVQTIIGCLCNKTTNLCLSFRHSFAIEK